MIIKTGIKKVENYLGIYALKNIIKGEIIFSINGKIVALPSKYSIQTGKIIHVEPFSKNTQDSTSSWQFLNHSCSPNSFIDTETSALIALKNIAAGDEICFNYNTTEYEMASPFQCKCVSEKCYGEIKGFKYLSEQDQKMLYPQAAPHIQLMSLNKKKDLVQ